MSTNHLPGVYFVSAREGDFYARADSLAQIRAAMPGIVWAGRVLDQSTAPEPDLTIVPIPGSERFDIERRTA